MSDYWGGGGGQAAPVPASSSSGDFWGGGGGGGSSNLAPAPPRPLLSPPPTPAKSGGGGGFFGGLKSLASAVVNNPVARFAGNAYGDMNNLLNPLSEVKNAARLANSTLTQTADLGRGIGGELTGLAHGQLTEQYVPAHLRPGFQPRDATGAPVGHPIGSNPATLFLARAPLVGGLGEMARQVGVLGAGAGEAATTGAGITQGHGFTHAAEQQLYHHPVQSVVNAALLASMAGGAAAGAGDAAGMEGLANAGRAVHAAATPVARLPFATLGGLGEAGGAVAERLGAEPGGRLSQMATGGLLGRGGVARTALSDLAAREPIVEPGLAQKVQQTMQRNQLQGLLRENDINRQQEQTNTTRVDRLTQQAVGADPTMERALNLRLTGHAAVYEPILSAAEKAGVDPTPILSELGVDEPTARLVTGRGTPEQEAAFARAESLQRPMAGTRQAEEIDGRGGRPLRDEAGAPVRDANGMTLTKAIHPEQAGSEPLSGPVADATVDANVRAQEAAAKLASAKAVAGIPEGRPLPSTALPPDQANVNALTLAAKLMGRASEAGNNPALHDLAAEHGLQSPGQIPEYLAQTKAALGLSNPTDSSLSSASKAAAEAEKAAVEAHAKAEADPLNAPARHRPALQAAQKAVDVTLSHADQTSDPAAAAALREGAARIPATLKALVDAGVDPIHMIGGREEEGASVGGHGPRGGAALPRERALTSEKFKSEGTVPSDIATHDVRLRDRINRVYGNEAAPVIDAKIGTTASEVPGTEGLTGRALTTALRDRGYSVWDPRNWREKMPDDLVKPGSRVIPTHLLDAFHAFYADRSLSPAAQTAVDLFDRGIRGSKGIAIALNPVAHFGFIMSDAIRNMAFGGIDPATYGARIAEAWREIRDQARTPEQMYPAEALRGYGAQEKGLVDAAAARAKPGLLGDRHPFSTAVSKGYGAMDFLQKVQRLALYNENLSRFEPEDVLHETLKVAGDYRNLSEYEQGVVKRLIPGYDFYKNAAKAAALLPIENPVRVAWLAHLAAVSAPLNKNAPNWVNPLGALTSVPRFALPIEAAGRLLGISPSRAISNIAKVPGVIAGTAKFSNPDLSAPGRQTGPVRTPGEAVSVLSGLLPQTKVAVAALRAPVGRYETGEPRPATSQYGGPLPGGRLGEVERAAGIKPYLTVPPQPKLVSSGGGRGRGGSRGGRGGGLRGRR